MFDTNDYPHTEGNRQILYAQIVSRIEEEDVENINEMALEDNDFEDNAFSDASSEAFRYCEEKDLFQHFKENEDTDECEEDPLPAECYDKNFF